MLEEQTNNRDIIITNLTHVNQQLKNRHVEDANLLEASQLTIKVLRQSLEEQTLISSQTSTSTKERISVLGEIEKEVERRLTPRKEHEEELKRGRRASLKEKERKRSSIKDISASFLGSPDEKSIVNDPSQRDLQLLEAIQQLNELKEENQKLHSQLESFLSSSIERGGDSSSVIVDMEDEEDNTRRPLIGTETRYKKKKKRSDSQTEEPETDSPAVKDSCWCCCIA